MEPKPRRAPSKPTATAASEPPVSAAATTAPEPARAALTDSAWWWIRTAAVVLALYFGWQLVEVVWHWVSAIIEVTVLGIFGIVLALVVQPLVEVLEKRGHLSRGIAAILVLLALLSLVALGVALVAGPLVGEADALSRQIPKLLAAVQAEYDQLAPKLRSTGFEVAPNAVQTIGGSNAGAHAAGLLLGGLAATVRTAVDAVVVLVVAFWVLKDGARMRHDVLQLLPVVVRSQVAFAFQATSAVVGGYVRAQLLIALTLGLAAGLGSQILGVPDPLVVGLAAGIFEMVPIVGPFAGGAVAVTLALTVSPLLALWTVLLFVGLHILEGYVLAPRVQARFTRIHEVVAFLSIFAGIEVAGFLGALFAVPTVSLLAIFIRAGLGDLRAEHPDLYESRGPVVNERQRRIVQEFHGGWWARLKARLARRRAASG